MTKMTDIRHPTTDNRELNVVSECRNLFFILKENVEKRTDYYLWQHVLKTLISVGSNLAEGNKRGSKEQIRFIRIAEGSMSEFEFQFSLLQIYDDKMYDKIDKIKAMIYKLRESVVRGR